MDERERPWWAVQWDLILADHIASIMLAVDKTNLLLPLHVVTHAEAMSRGRTSSAALKEGLRAFYVDVRILIDERNNIKISKNDCQ